MKYLRKYTLVCLLCISVFACGRHTNPALDDIESYIQQKPDSAYAVLKSWELSKSFKLFLTGSNLMNAAEFRNISVSPLMNSVEYINLRPRTVLLGLEWKR